MTGEILMLLCIIFCLVLVLSSSSPLWRLFGGIVIFAMTGELATMSVKTTQQELTPVDISVYHAVAAQTDSTPLITADGSIIDPQNLQPWVAISRDQLAAYPLNKSNPPTIVIRCKCPYDGETREVRDVMNGRYTTSIDLLVPESEVGKWSGVIYKP